MELLHNGKAVARAFGEAKNYELLSSHLDTFNQWLDDANFNPSISDGNPPDLAFMIAPSCPPLLKRKLELKNIRFIQSDQVITKVVPDPIVTNIKNPTNINTANKAELTAAFRGTGIKQATIDKLIEGRPYQYLNIMASKLKFTLAVKLKLRDKLKEQEICF